MICECYFSIEAVQWALLHLHHLLHQSNAETNIPDVPSPMSSNLCIHHYGLPPPPSHVFIHRIYLFPQLWITHCPLNVPLFSCWFPVPFNPALCPSIFYPFSRTKQILEVFSTIVSPLLISFILTAFYHVCTFLCASHILFHLTLWKRHTHILKVQTSEPSGEDVGIPALGSSTGPSVQKGLPEIPSRCLNLDFSP